MKRSSTKLFFFIITLIDINTKTETEEKNKINEQNDMNFLIVFCIEDCILIVFEESQHYFLFHPGEIVKH